ncbi:MAG: hypothetical protein IIW36_05830 [Clostridia bacterium]|jgi:hypothetical protein|nr:hypothetical protein [Clostridia bacterium]MBQ5834315.1 hypothetical protein [Clostridia bacterium]
MTCRELFDAAVRAVAENGTEACTEDYEERATYLLATFLHESATLDAIYRSANGLGSGTEPPDGVCIPLEKDFPLSDAFAPAAVYYLSAMLVLDENEEMSERFFALYSDRLSALRASLPARKERIKDCYPDPA